MGYRIFSDEAEYVPFVYLEPAVLKRLILGFQDIDSVSISAPLPIEASVDGGLVETLSHGRLEVWSRGGGDYFHPDMGADRLRGRPTDSIIRVHPHRSVPKPTYVYQPYSRTLTLSRRFFIRRLSYDHILTEEVLNLHDE
jgi:hypothetical protein